MKMNEEWFKALQDEFAGYCRFCDDITCEGGVEPDAHGYECPDCGRMTVMGMDNALIENHLDFNITENDFDLEPKENLI